MSNEKKAVIKADLTEMVFEAREKSYGAYLLRKAYRLHLAIGLAIVSAIFLVGTFVPVHAGLGDAEVDLSLLEEHRLIDIEDILPPPDQPEELPETPPKPPQPQVDVKTMAANIPVPAPDDELDEEDPTINEIDSLKLAKNISFEDSEGEDIALEFDQEDGEEEIPEVIGNGGEPDAGTFVFAEEEPNPVNMREVQDLIGYPQLARDANIEGPVVLRILVDKRGRYKKHLVIKAAHPILSSAVEAKISRLNFTPAIQGGRPIAFWVNVPFNFQLLN